MAADKSNASHVEFAASHEAVLTGVVALANLFGSCVEVFGLIHPSQRWVQDEHLLLTRLGLQQARLLIWGDVMGISSPPATVTDRAVPKHPSAVYPDLTEPTFFAQRDPRLDEPRMRTEIEQALSAIADRSAHHSREEMMAMYGLKPPKRALVRIEPALDVTRLEAFRQRWELLREVAESYAHLHTHRSHSIVHSSWVIADTAKFASFIALTQEKVDFLIALTGVNEQVDRAMSMDIRALGWHLSGDHGRIAIDVSKLRLLYQICRHDYPAYVPAIQTALDNIGRDAREAAGLMPFPTSVEVPAETTADNDTAEHHKRPGILKLFRSFGKSREHHSHSSSGNLSPDPEPQRSLSDAGLPSAEPAPLSRVRSKSIGGQTDSAVGSIDEEFLRYKMAQLNTKAATEPEPALMPTTPDPIRHDQYHGIARIDTKDLHQSSY